MNIFGMQRVVLEHSQGATYCTGTQMLRGRKLLFYILSKAVIVNGVSWPVIKDDIVTNFILNEGDRT